VTDDTRTREYRPIKKSPKYLALAAIQNRRSSFSGEGMQITRATDYAVRVLIHMANLPAGRRVLRSELAEATSVTENFLSKILQSLTRANLLESRRGPDGGFELIGRGDSITLLDVVEAMEGTVCLNLCLGRDGSCAKKSQCPAHQVWLEAQEALVRVLRKTSIADLAKQQTQQTSIDAAELSVP
jgi:Rrf2 family protein